ncbi:hypothetical protein Vadar_020885 [Vaccinium darrowii]|uniref:Uncharacterized protein n=1 Tax=Vaccinium darrowii TaxID=229202 RepID=A0ACB7YN78_9ERIC|nr:hypothetical protein Vadar_020885 [Vaccinium darrowii]
MNGAKRFAEAVGCKNTSVRECSALEESTHASNGGGSGSENVGLSNANIGENPMPRKPKGSSARFVHEGWEEDRRTVHSTWRDVLGDRVALYSVWTSLKGRLARNGSKLDRPVDDLENISLCQIDCQTISKNIPLRSD